MKKLISFSLAVSMLLSATACGREEDAGDGGSIDDLLDAAEDIIDPGFSGIVSSGRKYCVGENANDYRKEIQDEEDLDDEWLMIVEDGDISFFYADDFDEEADSDGRMPKKYKGMTLEEIHDAYVNEEQEIETTEEVTTAPVTTTVTTTTAPATTTAAAVQLPNGAEPLGVLNLSSGGKTPLTIVAWSYELEELVNNWIDVAGVDPSDVEFYNLDRAGFNVPEYIDRMFIEGDDIDVYFAEPDWVHRYIDNSNYAAPMSDLGFNESHFSHAYPYTITLGTSAYGEFTAPSLTVSPGAFAYNTALAEAYLGVTSPEEMQEAVGNWDKFRKSAETISDNTGGNVALADSASGFLFAYSQGKTSPWVSGGSFNSDDFCREMADAAKNLWDIGGISRNMQWTDDWTADGESQETMGYFVANWSVGGFLMDAAGGVGGSTYGNWAICQGPAPFFWGGNLAVVNPATDNGDLAQSFIYHSCVDDGCMTYNATVSDYYVNNTDVMEYAIDNQLIGISSDVSGNLGGQNYLREFHRNGLETQIPVSDFYYDADIRQLFINTLSDVYLQNGGSYDDVVDEVNVYTDMY
ncbi:MAG: hypothetical protein J6K77_05890 [Ruminococcus sp.]|nr:hypothetical protein [Ruminococcus sp.]